MAAQRKSIDCRDYPELEEPMAEAREKARLKMLQRIKRAAEDDWRAAAEFLRLSFPADYRRGSNISVEVNTAVQTGRGSAALPALPAADAESK